MQDDVLLVAVGEFGRTPRIHVHKGCPGREHWGSAGCALLYGGGLTMGQVIGSTNDKGERPQDRSVSYQDLLATIYYAMGIDPSYTLVNHEGRPVPILSTGKAIVELTGSRNQLLGASDRFLTTGQSRPARAEQLITLPAGATNADLAAVSDLSHVEKLVAHDSKIDDAGLSQLAHCRHLKCLQLNGVPITDAGLAHLSTLTSLEELNLTGTQVTDAGLAHLRSLTRLKRFHFNGTTVTLPGVVRLFVKDQQRTLADALGAMGLTRLDDQRNVVTINVAATPFGDDEMQYLGHLPKLKELHIAATNVTDAGMAHVRQLVQLEELYISKCAVSDAGLAHVAGLSRLRSLNIYGTQITSVGLEHLMELNDLRHLLITDLKLSPAAVDRLKAKLPQLTVTDYTKV